MRNHRLRERRERLGLSQAEIARRSGIAGFFQASVSAAEIAPASHPTHVHRYRITLVKIWREARDAKRMEAIEADLDRAEAERLAKQRSIWDALPDCPEKAALQAAMIERAIDMLDSGCGEGFDALVEFLPDQPVIEAADAWLDSVGLPVG